MNTILINPIVLSNYIFKTKSDLNLTYKRAHDITLDQLLIDLRAWRADKSLQSLLTHFENVSLMSDEMLIAKYNEIQLERKSPPINIAFNNLLSIHCVVPEYELEKYQFAVVHDFRRGNIVDDGYRGIHLYYKPSSYHYPIKLIVWDSVDARFNTWLKEYPEKLEGPLFGQYMRALYDQNVIQTQEDFTKWADNIVQKIRGE